MPIYRIKYIKEKVSDKEEKITSPDDVIKYVKDHGLFPREDSWREKCQIILIGPSGQAIGDFLISTGVESKCLIDGKLICKTALIAGAGKVIILHNHPMGKPHPTHYDIEETAKVKKMLDVLDITLLDHIILTDTEYYSFKEEVTKSIKTTAPQNNLQFIDLGLPSGKLWATQNVKDENGNEAYLTFDKAVEIYGKNLPSKEDWKELFDNCSCKWNKKEKGFYVTGPNGNSIFLPAAGFRGGGVKNVGTTGHYWSSSVNDEKSSVNDEKDAYNVHFYSSYLAPRNYSDRYFGFSVRLCKSK
jgi:DNA repair protein RadC